MARRLRGDAQTARGLREAAVPGPEAFPGQRGRREQMDVHPPEPAPPSTHWLRRRRALRPAPPPGLAGDFEAAPGPRSCDPARRRRVRPQRTDGRARPLREAAPRAVDRRRVDGRPRRRYRPESRRFPPRPRATPRDPPNGFVGTTQRRQTPGAFAGHEGLEPRPDNRGLFAKAAQLSRSPKQRIIDIQRRRHMHQDARLMHTMSRRATLSVPSARLLRVRWRGIR